MEVRDEKTAPLRESIREMTRFASRVNLVANINFVGYLNVGGGLATTN